jgi:uncharacterized protein
MSAIPEGGSLDVELRLESVVEGVLVSGTVRATIEGECARCLQPVGGDIEADVQRLYAYQGQEAPSAGNDERRGEEEDVDTLYGDLLDLRPAVRDAVVLELPLAPLCRPDCPGLCPTCGVRLADVPAEHAHSTRDPRWDALAHALTGQAGPEGESWQPESESKEA